METPLQIYRRVVLEQPVLDDSSFPVLWTRVRTGDQEARRQLSGCCLRLAEAKGSGRGEGDLLELIQDANGALVEALEVFPGSGLHALLDHVEQAVSRRLDTLS